MATPLSPEEEKQLRLFQQRVGDLRECGVVTKGKVTLNVTYPIGKIVEADDVPFTGFDRDHFRSAMQTLRQFMLDRDEVHFYRVCKLIRRRCDRQELVDWANYARDFWRRTLENHPLSFRAGGKTYDVKTAIDVMLYGFLSHTTKASADEWASLSSGAKATVYFIVQRSLFDLFYCLNLVDSVLLYWLDQPDAEVPRLGDVKCNDGDESSTSDSDSDD